MSRRTLPTARPQPPEVLVGDVLPVDRSISPPANAEDIGIALARLDEARQRALVDARGKDLSLIAALDRKIDDALAIMTTEKMESAKPKDLAVVLGILLDKREQLLSFDPVRTTSGKRKKARFQFAIDMTKGKAAVSVEQEG